MAYRARRREAQYRALLETAVDDYEVDGDPAQIADDLRRVRAEVTARRNARGSLTPMLQGHQRLSAPVPPGPEAEDLLSPAGDDGWRSILAVAG